MNYRKVKTEELLDSISPAKLEADGYEKVPAVYAYGGHQYFWYKRVGGVRHTVVWDRFHKSWVLYTEGCVKEKEA